MQDCCRYWNGDSFCSKRGAHHFPPWLFLMHEYFRSTLWRNSGRHRPCRRLGHIVPLSCDLCGFCLSGTQQSISTVRIVLKKPWKRRINLWCTYLREYFLTYPILLLFYDIEYILNIACTLIVSSYTKWDSNEFRNIQKQVEN